MATSVTNNSIIISFPGTDTSFVLENVVENGVLVFAEAPPGTSQIKNYAGMTWDGTIFTIDKGNGNSLIWDANSGAMDIVSENGVVLNIMMTAASTNNGVQSISDGLGVPGYFGTNNAGADAALQAYSQSTGYVWLSNPLRQTLINCFDNTFAEVFAVDNAGRLGIRVGAGISLSQPVLSLTSSSNNPSNAPGNVAATDPTSVYSVTLPEGYLIPPTAEFRYEFLLKFANNANNKSYEFKLDGTSIFQSGVLATAGGAILLSVAFSYVDGNTMAYEITGVSNDNPNLPSVVEYGTFDVTSYGGNGAAIPAFELQLTGDADDDVLVMKTRTTYYSAEY